MQRGIYTTGSGMIAAQRQLDQVAHNLANTSTTGFKRHALAFNDELERAVYDNAGQGRMIGTLGSGPTIMREDVIMEPGTPVMTGNPLHLAIQSREGFFAIQTPQGVRYTRDGSFSMDGNRQLISSHGFPVLNDQGQPIRLPVGQITMGQDGTISINDEPTARVGLFDGPVRKFGLGMFEGQNMQLMTNRRLMAEALESSNVNVIEDMVAMIKLNRAFEMAQRSITGQDELIQKLLTASQPAG